MSLDSQTVLGFSNMKGNFKPSHSLVMSQIIRNMITTTLVPSIRKNEDHQIVTPFKSLKTQKIIATLKRGEKMNLDH